MLSRAAAALVVALVAGCGARGSSASTEPQRQPNCGSCGSDGCRLSVRTAEEAQVIASCSRFRGDIAIGGAALTDLSPLSKLTHIDGSLHIGPTSGLTSLAGLGALERVTGVTELSGNFLLTGAFLPSLTATSSVIVRDNPALQTASFHRLEATGGVVIQRNRSLSRLDVSGLRTVDGDVMVFGNAVLTDVAMPAQAVVAGDRRIELGKAPAER